MPFIPAINTWRVGLSFVNNGGKPGANVIHVRDNSGSMDGTRAQELADAVRDWAVTDWADVAANSWYLTVIDVTSAQSQTGASASNTDVTSGARAEPQMPSQDTVAISLRTGAMGRSNRGRLYHVGLTEVDVVDGLLSGTAQTALINAYSALRSRLIADDFEWVIASYQADGVPRVTASLRPVNSVVIVDSEIDRQLGRK